MIARQLIVPDLFVEEQPPERKRAGSRAGRTATANRRSHRRRVRYAFLARLVKTVSLVTVVVFAYLALMANVTRMNYELTKNARTQAKLAGETARLDDQIARLESRERLAAIAAELGMRDPQTFAQVTLPPVTAQAPTPNGIALLSWLK